MRNKPHGVLLRFRLIRKGETSEPHRIAARAAAARNPERVSPWALA